MDSYYIWDRERKMWWKSRGRGYTNNLREAGEYTQAEAYLYSEGVPAGSDVPVRTDRVASGVYGEDINLFKLDTEESLIAEYEEWVKKNHLQEFDGDAQEMVMQEWLTDAQRAWLADFIQRWEVMAERDF